jgi:hypothetical protein
MKTKKEAYLQYINSHSEENLIYYKRLSAVAKRGIRKIRRQSWEKFVSNNIEYDVNGRQIKAYKLLKELSKPEKDNLQPNPISEKQWLDYYQQLWTDSDNEEITGLAMNDENVDAISIDELNTVLKNSKNRKTPRSDGINAELITYAPQAFLYRFFILSIYAGDMVIYLSNGMKLSLYLFLRKVIAKIVITTEELAS